MAGERALPGLGLLAFWTTGSNGYGDQAGSNLRILSALVQPRILSVEATAPTPVDGEIYLASAVWGGAAVNDIVIRDNGAWVAITPLEGWIVYNDATSLHIQFNGTAWVTLIGAAAVQAYDIRTAFTATPGDAEVIDSISLPRAVNFAANFAGSLGSVGVNPTASYTVDVKDDGTTIGTATVATGGAVTFTTVSGTAKTVAAGSILSFVSQAAADASVESGSFTLLGNL